MRLSGIQVALVIFAVSFKRESKTLDLKTVLNNKKKQVTFLVNGRKIKSQKSLEKILY